MSLKEIFPACLWMGSLTNVREELPKVSQQRLDWKPTQGSDPYGRTSSFILSIMYQESRASQHICFPHGGTGGYRSSTGSFLSS